MNAVLAVSLTAYVLVAYVSLFFVVPFCARVRFRNELWCLRDSLVDEIAADRFANEHQARLLASEIETIIANSEHVSVARIEVLTRLAREVDLDALGESFDPDALAEPDRSRLVEYEKQLYWCMGRHATFGTVSGWAYLGFATIRVLVRAFVRSLRTLITPPKLPRLRTVTRPKLPNLDAVVAEFHRALKERAREDVRPEEALTVLVQGALNGHRDKRPLSARAH